MVWGNKPTDGGHLLLNCDEVEGLRLSETQKQKYIRRFYGSAEFIQGKSRVCIWITEEHLEDAISINSINERIEGVRAMRLSSQAASTRDFAQWPYKFRQIQGIADKYSIPNKYFNDLAKVSLVFHYF